jgi:rhodanese-related sulfurtransferase
MQQYRKRKASGAVLLDVRNSDEVAAGILPEAMHIPLPDLEKRQSELPKSGEIYIYCRSGGRAQKALDLLNQLGFTNVVVAVDGGYETLCKDC